ncbi:MAG: ParB/RepB/Spo0J family partition protein [Deltaproteobacteria bacterium]|nr:ParB/RepB/Spo0J family partition protein [Deltaproteobacteria bacterium]
MTTERKRQALGKGLGALIPGIETTAEQGEFLVVSVEEVFPNSDQPRRAFNRGAMAELAASIREKGILQPLLVHRVPGGYELLAGERRLRAAKLAGLKTVPVILKRYPEDQKLELALIENIQREDLNPLEEAGAYGDLQGRFKYTQEQLAARLGKDRATVANALRLLKLPEFVKEKLAEGSISAGHARALLGVADTGEMRAMLNRILKRGLSVREVERAVRRGRSSPGKVSGSPDVSHETRALERRMEKSLGSKVRLRIGKNGGRIEIICTSAEELDGVIDRILKG